MKKGMIITDENKKILRVNQEFTAITGYTLKEVIGQEPSILSSGKHSDNFYQKMWKKIYAKGEWRGEVWNKTKSGELYLEWLTISRFEDAVTDKVYYVGVFSDITANEVHQQQLHKLAHHDDLTGLPNRTSLTNKLENLTNLSQGVKHFSLLFLDLDKFKEVNDTFGHKEGDRVLKEMAKRIKSSIRESDFIARQGGDEFVIILDSVNEITGIQSFISKLHKTLSQPYYINNHIHNLTVSIGASLYPGDGEDSEELMRKADIAMYEAKKAGHNRWRLYQPLMEKQNNALTNYLQLIQQAIANPEEYIEIHYQPIILPDERRGQRYRYFESLVRLRQNNQLIMPGEFIEICEQNNLIDEFGEVVLNAICEDIRKHEYFDACFSVNLSPIQFENPEFVETLKSIIHRNGMAFHHFKFEVTETAMIQNRNQIESSLHELREMGGEVLMDDFGTGYASLSVLKDLPIDTIKIDRSFCQDLENDQDSQILVNAMISLARALNLKVVCEGVESFSQFEWLKDKQIDFCQGYLFEKPKPLSLYS